MEIRKLYDYVIRIPGNELPVYKSEVYRYLGYSKITPTTEVDELIDKAISESTPLLSPALICRAFPVNMNNDETDMGFIITKSKDIRKNLLSSKDILLIAATIGSKFDMLLYRYSKTSAVMGCILQAIGAMFIESFLDEAMKQFREMAQTEGLKLRPRYSPGFGDFRLDVQKNIFNVMRMDRIGLTLNDSLLMSPSKSVTAVIGMYSDEM